MVEERPWCPRIEEQVQFQVLGEGAETQGDSVTTDSFLFQPTLSEPTNLPVSLRVKLEGAKAVRLARGGNRQRLSRVRVYEAILYLFGVGQSHLMESNAGRLPQCGNAYVSQLSC